MTISKFIIAVLAVFAAATTGADGRRGGPKDNGSSSACSKDALELVRLVNEYREQNGKPAIPVSSSMCITADAHVKDSIAMGIPEPNAQCNFHSWLDCCYTDENRECMWDKPSQLTCYPGDGYENSAWVTPGNLSPADALELWKHSGPHNNVMLNIGGWERQEFKAMGAGFGGGFAHLWFGTEPDCQ